eukprot:975915-Pyramimonas_sp.AAC.1
MIGTGMLSCLRRRRRFGYYTGLLVASGRGPFGHSRVCEGQEPLLQQLYWVRETHAGCATGTFGGAPYGATKGCTGWGRRMWASLLGPSVRLPTGPRS